VLEAEVDKLRREYLAAVEERADEDDDGTQAAMHEPGGVG
jgi:hypothetical protein